MNSTATLAIQVNNAPAPARGNGSPADNGGAEFGQALAREMDQRQPAAAAPAPAPARPAPQSKAPDQGGDAAQAPADAGQARSEGSAAGDTAAADTTAPASSAGGDDSGARSADDTAEQPADAAVTPVTDMLALAAALAQAQPAAPARAATGQPATDQADAATALTTAAAVPATVPAAAGANAKADAAPAFATALAEAGPASTRSAEAGTARHVRGEPAAEVAQLATEPRAAHGSARPAAADGGASPLAAALGRLSASTAQPKAEMAAEPAVKLAEAAALQAAAPSGPAIAALSPVHAGAFEIVHAAAGVAGERLSARVGSPGWDQQLGQKIVWMAAGGEQSASLTLNPPDLGPMQVVLSISNDQANVTFSSAQPEVRQALENAMPRLRDMMGESGIALGNASVNAGMPDQQQQAQNESARRSGFGPGPARAERDAGTEAAPAARAVRGGARGAVDTFA